MAYLCLMLCFPSSPKTQFILFEIILLSKGAKTLALIWVKAHVWFVLFEQRGIRMSRQKTLFELFLAMGGGGQGLAPESPTFTEEASTSGSLSSGFSGGSSGGCQIKVARWASQEIEVWVTLVNCQILYCD